MTANPSASDARPVVRLEDLTPGAHVRGVSGPRPVTVVDVTWHGSNAVTITYREDAGQVAQRLLYRDHEASLTMERGSRAYAFDGDPHLFRLAAEALRIRMAARFDPMLAVTTSDIEPLPHQIRAVYGELLPRTPLRFLLADDPGAGKTIMAGLYIKELMLRGDLARCLVVAPGSLVEQWQEELLDKFGLRFELLNRTLADATLDGNVFEEHPLLIARMDMLSRREDLKAAVQATSYDLVVVDEAHRMSAHYFGGELKMTKRYELGRLLGGVARHLLLMTATPHAGKEEDFQLVPGAARRRPVRGQVPRRCPLGGHRRAHAAHGQGGPAHLRGQAAVPRADRRDGPLRALPAGTGPLRGGHRLRPRGDEPGRRPQASGRGPARQHRRLRAHRPAAPAGLQPGGDPALAGAPPAPAGAAPACSSVAGRFVAAGAAPGPSCSAAMPW